jgi:hypothetical protein
MDLRKFDEYTPETQQLILEHQQLTDFLFDRRKRLVDEIAVLSKELDELNEEIEQGYKRHSEILDLP